MCEKLWTLPEIVQRDRELQKWREEHKAQLDQ
jgi:hypothetical protein